jgi:hypothetical protein
MKKLLLATAFAAALIVPALADNKYKIGNSVIMAHEGILACTTIEGSEAIWGKWSSWPPGTAFPSGCAHLANKSHWYVTRVGGPLLCVRGFNPEWPCYWVVTSDVFMDDIQGGFQQ